MRGDPPVPEDKAQAIGESTPHARGSTDRRLCAPLLPYVYPACAGIHLMLMDR